MKKKFYTPFLVVLSGFFLFSCDTADDCCVPPPVASGVFIVNAGNFGQANGELSFYDPMSGNIQNAVVKSANQGAEIAAGIESFFIHENHGYLLCNGPDKIEILDDDLKFAGNPITGIIAPRYMAASNSTGYVSCWGPFGPMFDLPDSYVAVIDLVSRRVVDTVRCGQGPEGLLVHDGKLFVANSYENSITVYRIGAKTYNTIALEAAPQHFTVDGQGKIWVSLGSFFGVYPSGETGMAIIDPAGETVETTLAVEGISDEGQIAYNANDGRLYFMKAEAWPGTATEVWFVNTSTRQLGNAPLISGDNFYGLGYNSSTDQLLITDARAFSGNGQLLVYTANGTLADTETTGIGPWQIVITD
jgi:DNA-binding beta-propeller fold protein YncE